MELTPEEIDEEERRLRLMRELEEKEKMEAAFDKAAETARVWAREGIDAAIQQGNRG